MCKEYSRVRHLSVAGNLWAGKGHDEAGLCVIESKAKEGGRRVVQPAGKDMPGVSIALSGLHAQGPKFCAVLHSRTDNHAV